MTALNELPPTAAADSPRLSGSLLRPSEAAELLWVRPSWAYESVRTNRLPCLRVGRHLRFTREMLEAWLAEQHVAQLAALGRFSGRVGAKLHAGPYTLVVAPGTGSLTGVKRTTAFTILNP